MVLRKGSKKGSIQKGFTLIELLFSVVICILILSSVLQAMVYLTSMINSNKKRSQVFQDIQATMERVNGTPFSNLTSTFPHNQVLSSTFVTNVLGGYKIPTESITVSYPNGVGSDPREIVITGQWAELGATRTVDLRTFRRG